MKKEAFKNIIGMKNKVIKVIPFGVDTSIFKPVLVEKKNIFTVGIAKSLKPIYGIDILIKAIYLLKEKYSIKDILLFIAGSGPEEIKLKKLVDDLGIKENVRFLGELDPIDIPYFLNEIDLLCSPSHSESFGVVFLEALACETPVIGTNVGGIPEVIDHKKDGLMVKPNDYKELASAINYLISDPKRRQEYGKKGRVKVISKYSINAYDTYIRELYREGKHGELF
ncbi:glycosyltransferase family 4 protein [Cytobacillus firmus]|uniref:glycosyltransferase family 4 protein n=1 Tax=Cytobacillus firmus TaxID=1399 RepID=UPI00069F2C25|nr:glycosyltransferase family 4 protein [Cytobacillus firmus]